MAIMKKKLPYLEAMWIGVLPSLSAKFGFEPRSINSFAILVLSERMKTRKINSNLQKKLI